MDIQYWLTVSLLPAFIGISLQHFCAPLAGQGNVTFPSTKICPALSPSSEPLSNFPRQNNVGRTDADGGGKRRGPRKRCYAWRRWWRPPREVCDRMKKLLPFSLHALLLLSVPPLHFFPALPPAVSVVLWDAVTLLERPPAAHAVGRQFGRSVGRPSVGRPRSCLKPRVRPTDGRTDRQ